jgi:tetratricopeptide (TPR) repeat protein
LTADNSYNQDMIAPLPMGERFVSPRFLGALLGLVLNVAGAVRAAEVDVAPQVQKQVDTALRSILIVGGILVVLILAAIAVIVYRKVLTASPADLPGLPADPLADAAAEERRGNFTAAAGHYEAGGDKLKAAECWERGKELVRAAECWEAAGELDRAAQLHVRSGSALRAAGIYMKTKNYMEAAKIFRNKGDHLRAAQALELYGNKLAAARAYSAAGSHAQAARLLEQERMYAEAAAAYQPLLEGDAITAANADRFSTHAALLALAGERDAAARTFRRVLDAVPDNARALSGLHKLMPHAAGAAATAAAPAPAPAKIAPEEVGAEFLEPGTPAPAARPSPPAAAAPALPVESPSPPLSPEELDRLIESDPALDGGDPLHRVFTLRSMIHAGRMDPRYSMRLWVQVMRALAERLAANKVLGALTPDSIVIDMENNVRIEPPAKPESEYLAPEVQAGLPPDRQADVYSMGVILYELVSGSLDQFGRKRAGEMFQDVPPWLDELIEHCTEKNLTKRYRTTEEVSAALLKLKSAAQE